MMKSDTPSTSTTLLLALKRNQAEAWERMVRLYGPMVYGWSRAGGLSAADAQDVVQEVFRDVHRGLPHFQRRSYRGWLATITRRRVIDRLRQANKHVSAAGGTTAQRMLMHIADPFQLPEAEDSADGRSRLVKQALELIRPEVRDSVWAAFRMTVIEERTPAEVARELGVSRDAVYKARARVLSRLRQELVDQLGEF